MEAKLTKQKPLFIGLSCLSVGCLIGSFAYPLQKLELYRQTERGQFDTIYTKTYLITENDLNYPYGFQKTKARKFAQIHVDYKIQKILLLALAAGCSISALLIGNETVPLSELESEIASIKAQAKKELTLKGIKHRFALASKSQQLLFLDEMKALMDEFGSSEQEILEADEINALYSEAEADETTEEAQEEEQPEDSFRAQFPAQMDETAWKAILKALTSGATKHEIIKDVLTCSDLTIGGAYIDYLKGKYL